MTEAAARAGISDFRGAAGGFHHGEGDPPGRPIPPPLLAMRNSQVPAGLYSIGRILRSGISSFSPPRMFTNQRTPQPQLIG